MPSATNPLDVQLALGAGVGNGAWLVPVPVNGLGTMRLAVWGTWTGGAVAKLQISPDGGTTGIDYPGASFTADGLTQVFLGQYDKVRLVVTGGTPSINATLCPVV